VEAPGGFRLVPGAVGVARMADLSDREREVILHGLSELDATSDAIVIDTGAGASPGVTAFARAADLTLVIATPEPTSIADAYGIVKCLLLGPGSDARTRETIRIELVVNQAVDEEEARAVHARIAGVAEKFLRYRLAFLTWIPSDPALPAAVRQRKPLMVAQQKSPAIAGIERVASGALERLGIRSACVASRRASWFGRVSALLAGSVSPGSAPAAR
jgi:flagellar biosynthesis protein FlhG